MTSMSSIFCLHSRLKMKRVNSGLKYMFNATSFSSWTKLYLTSPLSNRLVCLKDDIVPNFVSSDDNVKRISLGQTLSKTKGGFLTAMQMRDDLPVLSSSLKRINSGDNLTAADNVSITHIKFLDEYLRNWLSVVLSVDTLQLKRVTFESSSGDILEKVARGESVHRVRSLAELKRRLHDGRRCFALFHFCLPEDPLVFVHVGLTSQLAHSLTALDIHKNDTTPQCAMFYSINSPHSSLSGLNLASQLIKQGIAALQVQFPSLTTFSTLSPVPNFMKWLSGKAQSLDGLVIPQKHLLALESIATCRGLTLSADCSNTSRPQSLVQWLYGVLCESASNQSSPSWHTDATLSEAIKEPLLWLGAHYIANEKQRPRGGAGAIKGLPLDPVARFHLRNGATFLSINWMGNPSTPGLQSSAGLMVNYQYDAQLEQIESSAGRFESSFDVPRDASVDEILS